MKDVYKVVSIIRRPEGNEFISAYTREPRLIEKYAIGEKTTPNVGKVFVFVNQLDARYWARAYVRHHAILLCEGYGVEKAYRRICSSGKLLAPAVRMYWEALANAKYGTKKFTDNIDLFDALMRIQTQGLPEGSWWAKAVRPVKIVEEGITSFGRADP